jgi:predicted peroxiredoxin
MDEKSFIYGITHGFSLMNGTHDEPNLTPQTLLLNSGMSTRGLNAISFVIGKPLVGVQIICLADVSKKHLKKVRNVGVTTVEEIASVAKSAGVKMKP